MLRLAAALVLLVPSPALAGRVVARLPAVRAQTPVVRAQGPVALRTIPLASAPTLTPLAPLAAAPLAPAAESRGVIGTLKGAAQRVADAVRGKAAQPAPEAARPELDALFDGGRASGEAAVPASAAPAAGRSFLKRAIESIKELKIGSYNVENLFASVGSHEPDPSKPGAMVQVKNDAAPKPEWALKAQAKIILDQDLDIVTLGEVENAKALQDFNDLYLEGRYEVKLIEGNDERGIDVGFLVKKDLPFELEQRTHKDELWDDPLWGPGRKLFSRDLTSLVVRAPGRAEPLFVLFGTHYKSKRDRDKRDKESNILRAAQVRRTAEIIGRYRAEFGKDVPVMLAGDFNGAIGEEATFKPLFEAAGLTDAFDASPRPTTIWDRITHTFHPRGGRMKAHQMDAVLVSKDLRGTVKDSVVVRYLDENGEELPIPASYDERAKNPSDHFPVVVTLAFQPILKRAFPSWKPAPKAVPKPDAGFDFYASDSLQDSDPGLRERVMRLVRAYLKPAAPSRDAASLVDAAYYQGFEKLADLGIRPAAEIKRQIETMLAVLESVVPRAKAQTELEEAIDELVGRFRALLTAFDAARRAPTPEPIFAPKPSEAQAAKDFAASVRRWRSKRGQAFDDKIAEWGQWGSAPAEWIAARGKTGAINSYTAGNIPKTLAKITRLKLLKARLDEELAALPNDAATSAPAVRRLFAAWDELRAGAADALTIVGDSYDSDLSRRGLISNYDQNSGLHPGGFDLFLSAGEAADYEAAYVINEALAARRTPEGKDYLKEPAPYEPEGWRLAWTDTAERLLAGRDRFTHRFARAHVMDGSLEDLVARSHPLPGGWYSFWTLDARLTLLWRLDGDRRVLVVSVVPGAHDRDLEFYRKAVEIDSHGRFAFEDPARLVWSSRAQKQLNDGGRYNWFDVSQGLRDRLDGGGFGDAAPVPGSDLLSIPLKDGKLEAVIRADAGRTRVEVVELRESPRKRR